MAGTLRAAVAVQQEEISELKRLMGLAATAKWDTVRAQFAENMQSYAASFPEEARFYCPVLACRHRVIRDKNIEVSKILGEHLAEARVMDVAFQR